MENDKIFFQVVEVNGEKLFQISSKKKVLFFNKLLAVWFEGYHYSECKIFRNNELYDEGCVVYRGTHAASEFFADWKKITTEDLIDEICAEQLECGDIVEIENYNKPERRYYASVNYFMKYVVTFEQVGQSLDEAFAAHDNKLSREEFVQALISCSKGISWEDRLKKMNVVRL
jgi:hypothetical protein